MIVFWMKQKHIEPKDIRTMPKYPRNMDEVIDAMDLIVFHAEIGNCLCAASEFRGSL
jgi:hypothetical protein